MAKVVLTNMCMVYDKTNNKVLVQDRLKSWKGITFPGGHVEDGESIVDSTIREVKEETGLTISNLEPCGIIHWFNIETSERYFVFNFKTCDFTGELLDNPSEGKVFWVDKDDILKLSLSDGFEERLTMFFENKYIEAYGTWNRSSRSQLKFY